MRKISRGYFGRMRVYESVAERRPEDETPPPVPPPDDDAIKDLEDPEPVGPPAPEDEEPEDASA
jgi:hypothetical protein